MFAAQAIFMDDTTVKLLQKGQGKGRNKPKTARLWVYARDEKPWGSTSPPAAWYQFSTSRGAEHPSKHLETYTGFAHADAYAGYNDAYRTGRVTEMACMRMSAASLRRCMKALNRPQPGKPSSALPSFMRSRNAPGLNRPGSAWPYDRNTPSRSLMIWRHG